MTESRKKWASLVVLSLALAIIIIDTTILNVSISTIIREFKTDIQSIQWVITAYSLVLASLTITGGRLGDLFGRKKMFMAGAVIFAIGSFITSISHSVPTMIWGEAIIEGIGAALMMPATASLLVTIFRGRERAIAFGVWGGIAAASAAIGPILGGYLTTNYSWRWGFRVNILVVLLLLIGSMIIPESHDTEEKPTLDFGGVFLSATGLLSLVFGFIEASRYGWWMAKETFRIGSHALSFGNYSIVPVAIALGMIVLALFVAWETYMDKKGETPLVSLSLFSNWQFTSGLAVAGISSLAMSGLIFSIPVYLQAVRGMDAFHTGLSFLPMSLSVLVIAPLSAGLSHRIRPKYLIILGMILNTLGFLALRSEISVNATILSLSPGLILFGAGLGAVMSQVSNLTLSAVSVEEAGEASGVNNTLRQIGSTLGSAIIGSVLLTALATNLSAGVKSSSVIPHALKPQIAEAVSHQTSNVEFNGGAAVSANLPSQLNSEIVSIGHLATVDANKTALLWGALFSLLGLMMAFLLPNPKNVERNQSAAKH